ncbi:hypothetical protein DFJ74DRAFT_702307 [Hyaloraphidium curvatum]|nr:hypothetical protein DFJ74DRAFT_702307 [Hyaloraphidium curvatum]
MESSVSALRGTALNFLQTAASFAVALFVTLSGLATATGAEGSFAKPFLYLSVAFMVSSLFVAAKTVRDGQTADLLPGNPFSALIRGTQLWRIQAIGVALIAVVFPFYTVLGSSGLSGWNDELRFALLGLAFLVSSTLNLSKAVRDRSDADFFSTLSPTPELRRAVDMIAAGTSAFVAFNGISLVASFAATLVSLWTEDTLLQDRKVLVTIGVLFQAYAAFQVAKLVRDLADPALAGMHTKSYRLFTVIGFVAALGLLYGSLLTMPFSSAQQKLCVAGSLYVLSSTLSFSKLVRDQQERETAAKRK